MKKVFGMNGKGGRAAAAAALAFLLLCGAFWGRNALAAGKKKNAAAGEATGTESEESAVKGPGTENEESAGGWEIHLLLDSAKVLDRNGELTEEIRSSFDIRDKIKTFDVLYVETAGRTFSGEGWYNRIRMQEGKEKKGFELTYKKRYPMKNEDVAAAMRKAAEDGFDLQGGIWETEIEWTGSGMTLSVTAEGKAPAEASAAELSPEEAAEMLGGQMPDLEKNWKTQGWGAEAMKKARTAGPVRFRRYTGTCQGREVRIEIWPVPDQVSGEVNCIAELSFKCGDYADAAAGRKETAEALEKQGLLVKGDALKTGRILDAFLGARAGADAGAGL